MRTGKMFILLLFFGGILCACGPKPTQIVIIESTRIVPVTQQVTVEVTRVVTKPVIVTKAALTRAPLEVTRGIELSVARNQHTATRLNDGRILLVGGSRVPDDFLADAEIFNPTSGLLRTVASLHTARHGHTATLLNDGRVLVVGGYNFDWVKDAEIYDPDKDTWTVTQPLFPHGVGHTATRLKDGRVLVVGGCIGSGVCTEQVEIFDPQNDSWRSVAPLDSDRASQAAQLLDDGRVLIVGGGSDTGIPGDGDALLYDPRTNRWSPTGPMLIPRHLAQCLRLRDGRILVTGGFAVDDPTNQTMALTTEIYDPGSNSWTSAAEILRPRYGHSLILLADGQVLAIGGARSAPPWSANSFIHEIELYSPAIDRWRDIGELPYPRIHAATVLLPDGRVWMTGGETDKKYWSDTWLIDIQ